MRDWQVERRKRTRHLIELGGLVVTLIWMADKLRSEEGEQALALWAAKGKQGFEAEGGSISRDA